MATGPRLRGYQGDNVEELSSPGLVRRPLSVSSTSSIGDNDSVVDLTNEGTPRPASQSSAYQQNVLIIDSDEEIVEMELPTPPHRIRHKKLKPRKSQSKLGALRKGGECSFSIESKLSPRHANKKNDSVMASGPSSSTEASKSINCPVCMETVQQFEKDGRHLMATKCGHIFCNVCIGKAVKVQGKCPTCRKLVPRNSYHPIFLS